MWAPDYTPTADLKHYLKIDDDADNAEIAVWIPTASRSVDDHCNRQFGKVDAPEQRAYTAWYDYDRCRWVFDIDDLQTTVGLVFSINGTPITKYTLAPANAVLKGKAWTELIVARDAEAQPTGELYEGLGTATWGWTAFPKPVVLATWLQAARLEARRGSAFGIAGSPQDGSELRLLSKLDADVAVSLRGWRRPRKVG